MLIGSREAGERLAAELDREAWAVRQGLADPGAAAALEADRTPLERHVRDYLAPRR